MKLLGTRQREVIKGLYLLFFVDAVDAFLTYAGVMTGRIEEANPLMKNVVNNPLLLFGIKVFLPFTAIFVVLRFLKEDSRFFSKFTVLLLNTVILAYAVVLFLHAYWLFTTS